MTMRKTLSPRAFLRASLALAAFATGSHVAASPDAADPRFIDPVAIDRAVGEFTGAAIGEVGGARTRADSRLRLAACEGALDVAWHGTTRSSVRVECPGPDGWHIFVATRPAPAAASAALVIARGDPVTVVVRGRGFAVQQSGEALEAGAPGDWIAIRTVARGEPVRARVERPGLAVIPMH